VALAPWTTGVISSLEACLLDPSIINIKWLTINFDQSWVVTGLENKTGTGGGRVAYKSCLTVKRGPNLAVCNPMNRLRSFNSSPFKTDGLGKI